MPLTRGEIMKFITGQSA